MRGNALTDPTVVGLLQPFILAYWYGHPDDNPPEEVRPFIEHPERQDLPGGRSNVKALILDANGRLVDAFDTMPGRDQRGPWQDTIPRFFAERLRKARHVLGLAEESSLMRALQIPDLDGASRGIRVFVQLDDPMMPAYNVPLIEIARSEPADWDALAWSDEPRLMDPAVLKECFKEMYPAGNMDRQDKRTMIAYRVAKAEGSLQRTPAGRDTRRRYALLQGRITLTDEGPDGFSYAGDLQVVLTYPLDKPGLESLRGTFEAQYPRFDRMNNVERKFALRSVLESLPALAGE